jgi:hypothetical protein
MKIETVVIMNNSNVQEPEQDKSHLNLSFRNTGKKMILCWNFLVQLHVVMNCHRTICIYNAKLYVSEWLLFNVTIKLILATAPFIIYIALRSMSKNWRLRIWIMCLSGETYLLTKCFYCKLAIKIQLSMLVKYKVRIINIS